MSHQVYRDTLVYHCGSVSRVTTVPISGQPQSLSGSVTCSTVYSVAKQNTLVSQEIFPPSTLGGVSCCVKSITGHWSTTVDDCSGRPDWLSEKLEYEGN